MEPLTSIFHFSWNSTLGYSVILFLLMNLIYFLSGFLMPLFYRFFEHKTTKMFGFIFSSRSDIAAFGRPSLDIAKDHPSVMGVKLTAYDLYFGLYLAVAILHFCLVWFGLRQGQEWAWWALTFANLAIILSFLIAVRDFSVNLAPLRFSDLPPYITFPGFLLPVAVVLGWIGLH